MIKQIVKSIFAKIVKYDDNARNEAIEKSIADTEQKKPNIFPKIINELILEAMEIRKGVNVSVTWERNCHVYKKVTDEIRKRTTMVCRLGIDYDNQKAVIEKRETGELPIERQPIWHGYGIWVIYNYLIMHKKTGQLYLRLYEGTCKLHHPQVQYFKNGQKVSKEEIEHLLTAKETSDKKGDCFCVKIEDMVAIGKDNSELPPIKDRDSITVKEDVEETIDA